jgi:hypothetical protein
MATLLRRLGRRQRHDDPTRIPCRHRYLDGKISQQGPWGDDVPSLSRRSNSAPRTTRTVGLAGVSAWRDPAYRAVGVRLRDRDRRMDGWGECGHAAGEGRRMTVLANRTCGQSSRKRPAMMHTPEMETFHIVPRPEVPPASG